MVRLLSEAANISPIASSLDSSHYRIGFSAAGLFLLAGAIAGLKLPILIGIGIAVLLIGIVFTMRARLNDRKNDLVALNRLTQVMNTDLPAGALMQAVYNELQARYDIPFFYVALFDNDRNQITFPLVIENRQPGAWASCAPTNDLTEYVIRTRQPLLLPDHVPQRLSQLGLDAPDRPIACYLGLPLVVGDKVTGMVALMHDSRERVYCHSDILLLSSAANQMAAALKNADLVHEKQTAADQLHELIETSRMFAASLDLEQVSQTIVQRLATIPRVQHASLYRWHSDSNKLHLLGHAPETSTNFGVYLLAERQNRLEQVCTERQTQTITLGDTQSHEVLLIPLTIHEQTIGLLALWQCEGQPCSPHELHLIEATVNQAAAALQNAIHFSSADATLRERVIELSAIEVISRHTSATLDLQTIINDVVAAAMTAINAAIGRCALMISGDQYALVSRLGNQGNAFETPHTGNLQAGVTGRVIQTRKPALVSDTQADPEYISLEPNMRSELCVPILRKGQPIGVLDFEDPRVNAFSQSHVRFVSMLAEHAAIAIENARLFSDRRRQIETLLSLRKLSLRLLSALDLSSVVNAIVEHAQEITNAQSVYLYLGPGSTDNLMFVASIGSNDDQNQSCAGRGRYENALQVAQTGQPYYSASVMSFSPYHAVTPGIDFDELACIPIQRAGQVLGVLEIAFNDSHYYTQNEIQALEVLANQAAVAIENVRLYEAVREGRDQLQAILDSTYEAMFLLDNQGRLLTANPAADKMVGQPLSTYIGQSFLSWLRNTGASQLRKQYGYTLPQMRRYILDILQDPSQITHRQFEQVQGEETRYIDETGSPVLDQNGLLVGWLLVWRDITEEHKLSDLREELSNMIIHDLRSPLTAIISSLSMLQDLLFEQDVDVVTFSDVIRVAENSGENMLNLVQSLLDIARLEQHTMRLDCASYELNNIVDNACAAVLSLALGANIDLAVNVPDDLPHVWIDSEKVQRILVNLLDNALRHTPIDGRIDIEAAPSLDSSEIIIRVIDTGPGIPPGTDSLIFEKFAQLDQQVLRGHKGTGLGLTFCKLAVEAHGGHIWVEDGPTGGAAFCFTVPTENPIKN
jgi:PAS domain S-box-containing protein